MEDGALKRRCQNLESSILFMQKNHAETLQALQAELQKLQRKCADLTFQVAMQSSDSAGAAFADAEKLEQQLKEKNRLITDKDKELSSLKQKLSLAEASSKHFEEKYKEAERALRISTEEHSKLLDNLTKNLEAKSNMVAYLSTTLHKMKISQVDQNVTVPENLTPLTTATSVSQRNYITPTPPKVPRSDSHQRVLVPNSNDNNNRFYLSSRSRNLTPVVTTRSPAPDPSPFLATSTLRSIISPPTRFVTVSRPSLGQTTISTQDADYCVPSTSLQVPKVCSKALDQKTTSTKE